MTSWPFSQILICSSVSPVAMYRPEGENRIILTGHSCSASGKGRSAVKDWFIGPRLTARLRRYARRSCYLNFPSYISTANNRDSLPGDVLVLLGINFVVISLLLDAFHEASGPLLNLNEHGGNWGLNALSA